MSGWIGRAGYPTTARVHITELLAAQLGWNDEPTRYAEKEMKERPGGIVEWDPCSCDSGG